MERKKPGHSSAPSRWPQAIPRSERQALDTDRSCLVRRRPLWENEHYDDHRVQLSGNLLAVAVRGSLVLRRGEETRVIQEGDACLLSAGPLTVTEVPPAAIGSAEILYIFFGDRAVRRRFGDLAKIERMAFTMTPAPIELPRLTNFVAQALPFLSGDHGGITGSFARLLGVTFRHGWAGAWMFLKAFFARRRTLHLHLEKFVFPITSAETIMDAYSSGRRQFKQDFGAQYDVSLARWLTWRRLEVAHLKIRCVTSLSVERIAAAAGYRNFPRFRHQFRHRFGLWPEEVVREKSQEKFSPQELAPFWHWSYPEAFYIQEANLAFLTRSHNAQYPRRERRRLRRAELIRLGHAEPEPSVEHKLALPILATMDVAPANVIPFESSGFENFLEIEASLDVPDDLKILAA